jgi:hypothetical protein
VPHNTRYKAALGMKDRGISNTFAEWAEGGDDATANRHQTSVDIIT